MRRELVALATLSLLLAAAQATGDGRDGAKDPEQGEPPRSDSKASQAKTPKGDSASSDTDPTVYIPPPRGSARTREGAGTRAAGHLPALEVLAPDHVGLTTRAGPVVVWYTTAPNPARVEFTLAEPASAQPLVERTLAEKTEAGFHPVSLAELGVQLEEGRDYVWSIALVSDPERRDRDVVATALIRRIAPSAVLEQALREGAPSYRALARNGIWYDALADLGARIAKQPDDGALRRARSALLEQVGLVASAAADRDAVPR